MYCNRRNFAVALGLLLGRVVGEASNFPLLDRFAGHYVLLRDQSEDIRRAIERATENMNFFVRPIARRLLRQKTILYPSFSLERSGEFLHTSLAGEPPLLLPLSGAAVPWKAPDGETVRVRLILGQQALRQIFEAKQGRRENRFTLSSDGGLLMMDVTITSNELPQPVKYQLIYRRDLALPTSTLRAP
ncbi:MAG: hypothetical protein JO182_32115 [Acidobacteriaceae bacterium]|nr:hypothetical protein [Acidobacteriaceae bacterium]